jgi:hypothetical protein
MQYPNTPQDIIVLITKKIVSTDVIGSITLIATNAPEDLIKLYAFN